MSPLMPGRPLTFRRIARRSSSQRGFTLLEVLLTSLLASVVLIALWSLSDIYLRLFVSGRNKIEETQLARSLTSQFARDISQVAQRPEENRPILSIDRLPGVPMSVGPQVPPSSMPPANSSPMNGPRLGLRPGMRPSPAQTGFDAAAPGQAEIPRPIDDSVPRFGLFGTSDALRLIVLQIDPRTTRAPTDLSEVLPEPGRPRMPFASELRTIEYSLGASRESTDQDQRHPPGLIRREWAWEHWIGIRSASQLSVGGTEAAEMLPKGEAGWTAEDAIAFEDQEYLHVPQVQSVEFSYYDGEEWDIEWNSWERGKLPVLVEVLLEFQIDSKPKTKATESGSTDLAGDSDSSTAAGGATGGTVYRRLIHLPFANDAKSKPGPEMTPVTRSSPALTGTSAPGSGGRQP